MVLPENGETGRHVPTRTCVGCGEKGPKDGLLRLARGPDGLARLDPAGRAPGRGAWVHARAECLARAEAPRALGRAFRGSAKAPQAGSLLAEAVAAGVRLDETGRGGGAG